MTASLALCPAAASAADPVRVLVSNIGDGTRQMVGVADDGKLKSLGKAQVGTAPKRVAFLPVSKEGK